MTVSPGLRSVLDEALATADLLAAHADTELSAYVRGRAAAERRSRMEAAWDAALADDADAAAALAVEAEVWAAWRPTGETTSAFRAFRAGLGEPAPDQPVQEMAVLVADVLITDPARQFFHESRPGFDLRPAVVDAANPGHRHPGVSDLHLAAVARLAATGERVAVM